MRSFYNFHAILGTIVLAVCFLLAPGHLVANSLHLPKAPAVQKAPPLVEKPVVQEMPVQREIVVEEKPELRPVEETPVVREEKKVRSMADILGGMGAKETQDKAPVKNPMSLPENNKIDFLEGKWRCDSGLFRVSDKEPVVLEFSFDKNGNGKSWIREKNGKLYETKVKAKLNDRKLTVKTEGSYRSKNSKGGYNGLTITCRQKGDFASCSGKHENNGPEWKDAYFERVH